MQHRIEKYKNISREDFMNFSRDNERLNELSPENRNEIFRTIFIGNYVSTKNLLDGILSNYSVSRLKVIELENGEE